MRLNARIATGLLGLALAAPAAAAYAERVPEYELKAALLYNLTHFVEWPEGRNRSFNVCIVGEDPFGALADALATKTVNGKPIAVRRAAVSPELKSCQILFVAASEADSLGPILEAVKGQPVLTVADADGSARRGAVVTLALEGPRIAFDIDATTARAAGLSISSKLLRLARTVY